MTAASHEHGITVGSCQSQDCIVFVGINVEMVWRLLVAVWNHLRLEGLGDLAVFLSHWWRSLLSPQHFRNGRHRRIFFGLHIEKPPFGLTGLLLRGLVGPGSGGKGSRQAKKGRPKLALSTD